MIADSFAHFCLKFGHITFILPIVVLCMTFHKRELYAKAVCFLFFVMIWNTLLKQLFKVPLFPHLGSGYAFPSGHMHATAIFYGYILYRTKDKLIKTLLAALLVCVAFSLVHCRFHDWFDVLGALGFAIAEIYIYHIIKMNFGESITAVSAIIFSLGIMCTLSVIYRVEYHVWLAFYALTGTILSLVFIKDVKPKNLLQKVCAVIIIIALAALVYAIFRAINFGKPAFSEIKFFLLPIIIMGSIKQSSKFRF